MLLLSSHFYEKETDNFDRNLKKARAAIQKRTMLKKPHGKWNFIKKFRSLSPSHPASDSTLTYVLLN